MKTKKLFLLPALVAVLNLMPVGQVTAQTFTTLHSFSGGGGENSWAGLVLSSNRLYGTTLGIGELSAYGAVFAVGTDGTGFTNLHNLASGPWAGLIISGNTLYGTAIGGDQPFQGSNTVFSGAIDGTGLTNLHTFSPVPSYGNFSNADGTYPRAALILSGNTLYGTASIGGIAGIGTVFAVRTNGTGFVVLHHFSGPSSGANPHAGLILSGNTLYGTTSYGGSSDNGTVFAISTNGTDFTNLHSFAALNSTNFTNGEGANPQAGLVLSGNTLYGTALFGGSSGKGTVFAIRTNGTDFTNLHSFAALNSTNFTNGEGANPNTTLVLSGDTLYGTARYGGSSARGTIFAIRTNGTGFANIHSFTGGTDGASPRGGLILAGNNLYGTTASEGSLYYGTVFRLSLEPQLTLVRSGANAVLSWPTNATGFTLQSSTNLNSTNLWTTNLPAPSIVNGRYTVTNSTADKQRFYRLSK